MIGTKEANNESMRINAASIMCDKNRVFNFKTFLIVHQVVFFWNSYMVVKVILRHNKIQDISKMKRRYYHLLEKDVQYINIKKSWRFQEEY